MSGPSNVNDKNILNPLPGKAGVAVNRTQSPSGNIPNDRLYFENTGGPVPFYADQEFTNGNAVVSCTTNTAGQYELKTSTQDTFSTFHYDLNLETGMVHFYGNIYPRIDWDYNILPWTLTQVSEYGNFMSFVSEISSKLPTELSDVKSYIDNNVAFGIKHSAAASGIQTISWQSGISNKTVNIETASDLTASNAWSLLTSTTNSSISTSATNMLQFLRINMSDSQ